MNKNRVVSFERGADFYFDLGYKYIQKGELKTALRYMEKAAGIKPDDSFLQFNYAGILAELGYLDHSTEVLLHIVKNLDVEYAECYFGLGCNYLQMQKIKKAIEYFNLYLDKEPDGEFSEEAEELLEMLMMIKDANNDLDDEELDKIYKIEEEAINHLEAREYEKAVKKFEAVVQMLPNAVPARNNLSLAYYYMGQLDKAIEFAREVLFYEPDNIHANCNLAIFYFKMNLKSWVEKQARKIKKLYTDNADYQYKIADTFGSIGKHTHAYSAYKKLLSLRADEVLYVHYAALSAFNTKRFKESIKLWAQLKDLDPDNFLSEFYSQKALVCIEKEEDFECFPYTYQLPRDEIGRRMDVIYKFLALSKTESKEMLLSNKEMLSTLYFGICFDPSILRKLVYNKLKGEGLSEAEGIIRKYMLRDTIENYIKIESVFLLSALGAKEPYTARFDDEIKNVTIDPHSFPESEWKKEWERVKNKTIQMMKGCYKGPYKKIVEDIWYDFIKSNYPEVPAMNRIDIWAAALEYTFCRFYYTEVTQQKMADKYKISKNALGDKFRMIYHSIGKKHHL